jgi:hypothetical protein
MKIRFALVAMTGLALAGCNRGATNNSANASANSTNSTNAAASSPGAAAAGGSPVTQAALVGTWGQDNCSNSMTFAADGTATSTTAQQGNNRWSLDGSTIVITSPGQPEVRMPATISGDNLQLGNGQGQNTVLSRCPTPAGAANPPAADNQAEAEENSEKSE